MRDYQIRELWRLVINGDDYRAVLVPTGDRLAVALIRNGLCVDAVDIRYVMCTIHHI